MMRNVEKSLIISAVLMLLIAQIPLVLAEDTKVSVSAPDGVKPGDIFSAYIMIKDVMDLDAAQFDLTFDSDVIAVVDVKNGEIEGKDVPVLLWSLNPNDPGKLRVVCDFPDADGVSGSGYLAEIIFEVKGADGDASSIEISDGLLGNNKAEEITVDWAGCRIEVSASATSQPTESQGSSYQGSSGYGFNETETSGETATVSSGKVTRSIPSILAGTKTSVVFSDMDISMITLDVDQDLTDIKLSIQPIALPDGIPEPERVVYTCYEISADGLGGADVTATIDLRVPKSWIEENNINKATITLNRYHNGKWQILPTFMVGEDNNYVNYEAETEGFSYFAITGEVLTGSETTTPASTHATSTPIPTATPFGGETTADGGAAITWSVILAAILATAAVCTVIFFLISRKKSE